MISTPPKKQISSQNRKACWGIAKILEICKQSVKIQFLKQATIKELHVNKQPNIKEQFNEVGSKVVEKVFRRIFMRRWSQSASKMVFFESQLVIGLPKWSSYSDMLVFIDQYLQKLRKASPAKISRNASSASHSFEDLESQQILFEEDLRLTSLNSSFMEDYKLPYVIHFIQPQNNCCIFCQKQLQPFHNVEEIKKCCQPNDKSVPLPWVNQQKQFCLTVDWVEISEYNESYFNSIEIDNFSVTAQQKMKSEKITLEQCLDLWKKPETIQMQCQKCKFDEHLLQTSIKKSPIITVFHLKEFRYTEQGHFIKLNINLQWTESINLLDYYSQPNQMTKGSVYQMYSVITHKGNTNSGHYTSMAKRKHPLQRNKIWVNFDDDKTQILTQKPQTIQNAYLLFFKKVDIPSSAVVHFSI